MFLASPADIAIYGGQAGGGKTFALLMEAARHAFYNPKFGAVIFRRTSPQVTNEGGLWDTSAELYQHTDAQPYQSPTHEWRFPCGARIAFHHLQHDKNRFDWKGAQLALTGWDQLEEFSEKQFWYLFSRARSMSGVAPYVRATCNPVPADDPVGGWLRHILDWWIDVEGYPIPERMGVLRWFVRHRDELLWFNSKAEANERAEELGLPVDVSAKSLTFIAASLEDNPTLLANDPGYLATLEALPHVERMRLRGGNWNVRDVAGELIDRAWFGAPVDAAPATIQAVRYWDKAGTEGGKGAESAGVRIVGPVNGMIYITDIVHGRWSALQRELVIEQTAGNDGDGTIVVTEQEPGSGGKESAEATIRNLLGYEVYADPATGDKIVRSGPFRAQAEAGNIKLVRGDWNEDFLRQAQNFAPGRGVKDMVDAAVGAFNWLAKELNRPVPAVSMVRALEGTEVPSAWRVQ